MALVLKDRVKETSTTAGTGTLTLDGAASGFQSFAAVGNGNTTYYAIVDPITGDWEVGLGTYTSSGTTLSRTTVLSSSNSGSLVNFAANQKDVFVTYPSEKSVYEDASNVVNATSFGAITATSAALTTGTVSTTPASNTDIANKQYVDGLVTQGISYHEPVYVESPNTTGNLNATYNNGASGVGATLTNAGTQVALTVDGILMTVGKRVLIYNQTNATQNGVYTVTTVGDGSTNWVLTRATDANTYGLRDPNALGYNDAFFVTNGNTGAGETYVCTTTGTITFGTTNITFAQISSAQVYTAGTGLNLSPATTFNISNTGVSASTYGSASAVPVFAVNAQGQLTSVTNTNIAISGSAVSGNIAGSAGSVANALTAGSYLTSAGTFDGSAARTFAVDATSANTASKVVARDASGNFSAGTITATLSGNASTATAATNISAGAANQIPYQTGAATTSFITAPTTAGTYLNWNGSAFAYTAISTPAAVTFNNSGSGDASGTSFNGSTARTISYNTVGASPLAGSTSLTTTGTVTTGTWSGLFGAVSGANLTSLTAANLSGTVAVANGGTASSTAGGARTNLGATTLGSNLFTITNPSAVTFPRFNADNTVSSLDAATFRSAIGAGTSSTTGTVTSVSGTGSYGGLTLTGTVTTSGSLTLGGTPTGTWPISVSGNAATATSATSATTAGSITSQANSATITATSANTANQIVLRDASGNFSAGTITASLNGNASTSSSTSGNAATATALTSTQSSWTASVSGNVVGLLGWKNYGNSHVIFDASAGTSPSGGAVNNTNPTYAWSGTYPTLMGWNGSATYGVRVDSSRYSDSASTLNGYTQNASSGANTIVQRDGSGYIQNSYFYTSSGGAERNTSGMGYFAGFNSGDYYIRSYTNGAAAAIIQSAASGSWGINITGNAANITAYTINQSVGTGNSPTFSDLYVSNWFRNNTSNTGLYNQSTTQHLSSNTNGYWDMSSTTSVSGIRLYTGGHVTSLRGYVYADSSNNIGFLNNAGSWSFQVSSGGNCTATGSVTAYSDERLKKDWAPLQEGFVAKLAKVKSGTYTRIDSDERQAGVGAQSFQPLLPETVLTSNDGTLSVAYGNAAMVSAVELAKDNVELRARIEKLEALVAKLIEG